uniref:DUF504 domain-containing protein n=1 Tax=Ignisphaera aggregans TaxID=334771 RepID=A0A7C4FGZ4_9CREN
MRVKDAVNRILWTVKERKELEKYRLIITDRINPRGYIEVPFTNIARVDNNYIYITSDDEINVIPIHRVIRIVKNHETVYDRLK